jgi:hypothetical protein
MCASHNAESSHLKTVRSILMKAVIYFSYPIYKISIMDIYTNHISAMLFDTCF